MLDGVPYAMAAPKRIHQEIVTALSAQLYNFFKDTDCSSYVASFDVRLPEADEQDEDVKSTVQPDLSVICDQDKLDELGCRGTPDSIIEVLSPSTALQVECSKKLSRDYPVGTKFMLQAKLTDRENGGEFLYSSYRWKYDVVS